MVPRPEGDDEGGTRAMNGGQAVAEVLRREGVGVVFCIPSNPLIDSLAAVGIKPIVARERSGAWSTWPTPSPGSTTAARSGCAWSRGARCRARLRRDRTGLLRLGPTALPARRRRALAGSGCGPRSTRSKAYRPITKWASRFNTAASVPDQLRRAFSKMRSARPGPVVVEMPADVMGEELPGRGLLLRAAASAPQRRRRGPTSSAPSPPPRGAAAVAARRPGGPLGRGDRRARGVRGAPRHPGDDDLHGQERLPRAPPARPRRRRCRGEPGDPRARCPTPTSSSASARA